MSDELTPTGLDEHDPERVPPTDLSRRRFLEASAVGAGAMLLGCPTPPPDEPTPPQVATPEPPDPDPEPEDGTPMAFPRALLFDFEEGVEEWYGNPWGGGTCGPSAAEGRYGSGLAATWTGVPGRRGNVISPMFDPAVLQARDLPFLSFWARGDGSSAQAAVKVFTRDEAGASLGYSALVSLSNPQWHRQAVDLRTAYNREKVPFDARTAWRLYFVGGGDTRLEVD
jgi:hypothetical protein